MAIAENAFSELLSESLWEAGLVLLTAEQRIYFFRSRQPAALRSILFHLYQAS